MRDHYKTLGLSSAATNAEIRRAYRILARRYHPDVNPGRSTTEQFRWISEAYEVLSDPLQRKAYDQERDLLDTFSTAFDRAHQAYRRQQQAAHSTVKRPAPRPQQSGQSTTQSTQRSEAEEKGPTKRTVVRISSRLKADASENITARVKKLATQARSTAETLKTWIDPFAAKKTPPKKSAISSFSVVEVSISIFEAISGVRKSIEIPEADGGTHKLSVLIPAGVRQGSIVKAQSHAESREQVIVVIRVADHPWLSISHRGLTMNLPITISEAITGAKIQVPSLGEPLLVTIEPGMQSGKEVRLKGQGVFLADGARGDLYIRFLIKTPPLTDPVSLAQACAPINALYSGDVRSELPKKIGEERQS
jgi:curved DNA-binding protein